MIKKFIQKAGLFLMLPLLLIGCGTDEPQTENESSLHETGTEIAFEHVELEEAPQSVRSAVEFKSRKESTFVLPGEDDEIYIVVTRGEKPTGGFTVDILHVIEQEDAIVTLYKFKDPADDELVTQAITYPFDLVKIDKTDKTIKFKKIEHENELEEGFNIQL